MDLLSNLMDPNKGLQHILVPSAQVDAAIEVEPQDNYNYEETDFQSSECDSNEYAKAYQEKEAKLYANTTRQHTVTVKNLSVMSFSFVYVCNIQCVWFLKSMFLILVFLFIYKISRPV